MTGSQARFDLSSLQRRTLAPLQWCAVLIGASVTVSVALDNVLLALLLLGVLVNLGGVSRILAGQPVVRSALLLFAVLFFAVFHGATPLRDAVSILGKYIDLMFIPVFILLFSNETVRRRARYAFLAGMLVTLVLSYLLDMQVLPVMSWMVERIAEAANPIVFHSHITQNNMMAFATFLALLEWREATTRAKQISWALFALLAGFNVLFMVQGRTGYLVLLLLLAWFAWTTLAHRARQQGRSWGWRQGLLIVMTFIGAAVVAYNASSRLHERVALVVSEYQAWTPDHGKLTSTGQRLDFYSNTLQIVRQHPLLGVGTGGFEAAFAKQTQGKDVLQTGNPHNEYLMISVQTGIVGLALLLYLFYTQWRWAPSLPSRLEQDAGRGLVLAYAVNCLFNSALLDHADGLFFAFMTATLYAGLKRRA